MSVRTVEMDDTLQEHVDNAIEGAKEILIQYLEENSDTEETPDMNDLDYDGTIHEIIDGSVPIYTKEINDTYYLYSNELEEAFDNAGMGEKTDKSWPMGWKAAAIYCYINDKVWEWYGNNAEDIFDEWYKKQNPEEE